MKEFQTVFDTKSRAICILGMHRSGTSTITRAINLLGAYLGEEKDLIPPAPDNPEGFWERGDVVALHDRILERFKRLSDTVAPLPVGWHTTHSAHHLKEELRVLIRDNFSHTSLWAWKDPRTCLTFDLWKQLLSELSTDLCCVFTVRSPLDVAKSLKKRNDMPFDKALGFWMNDNLVALEACSDIPTVFINYDEFVESWEPELRRVAETLHLEWPANGEELKSEMDSFVQPGLRHNRSSSADLDSIPAPVRELYQLILGQTRKPERETVFHNRVRQLAAEYRTYSSFFSADMDYLFDRGKRLLDLDRQAEEAIGTTADEAEQGPATAGSSANAATACPVSKPATGTSKN